MIHAKHARVRGMRAPTLCLGAIGLATLLSGLNPAQAAPADGAASLLPKDTLFVMSVDDHAAFKKGQADMPLTKIMAEDEVKTFLEKPTTMARQAIGKLQEQIRSQEGFEDFEMSLDDLFAGNYGKVFVALTHVGMPDPQAGRMMPDIGLVLGIEPSQGAPDWQRVIKDLIGRAAQSTGKDVGFKAVDAGSYSYEEMTGGKDQRPPVVMGRVGDLQLFSLSHETMRMVMDRASGSAQGSALTDNASFQTAARQIGIEDKGAIRFYMNMNLGVRLMAEGIKFALQAQNETEFVPLVDQLLEKSGLLGLSSVSSAGYSKDGVAISKGFVGVEGELKGLLALAPDEPIDLAVLDVVPKNATSLSIFKVDLGAAYDFAMDVFQTVAEDEYNQAQGMLQGFGAQIAGEGNPPFDLRNDLLANLGPQWVVLQPQSSNAMMPSFLIMAETGDGAKLMQGIQNLLTFGSMMSNGEFSSKMTAYKEVDILQVDIGAEAGIPISPCAAILDNYFILSLSVGDLKRHIRRAAKPGESIKSNEDFQRFYATIPEGAELTSLKYTDIKFTVESMYGQLAMAVPMLTMAADFELPVEMALLPTQETITQHLYGSLAYSTSNDKGSTMTGYSPVGGELLGLLAAGAIGGGALWVDMAQLSPASRATATPTQPVEESPNDQVRHDLANLKAGVTIYKLQNGALPDSLSQLLEPSEAYPHGCLGASELPSDPWGHGYSYKKAGSGYVLWSFGANGQDDGGAGDDIKVEKK